MSIYGEDGETGYDKENLFYTITDFLENHSISELLEILKDAIDRTAGQTK